MDDELEIDLNVDSSEVVLDEGTTPRNRSPLKSPDSQSSQLGARRRQRPRGYSPDLDVQSPKVKDPRQEISKQDHTPSSSALELVPVARRQSRGRDASSTAETPPVEEMLQPRQRKKVSHRFSPTPDTPASKNIAPRRRSSTGPEKFNMADLSRVLASKYSQITNFELTAADRTRLGLPRSRFAASASRRSIPVMDRRSLGPSKPSLSRRSVQPPRTFAALSAPLKVEVEDDDTGFNQDEPRVVRMADIGAPPSPGLLGADLLSETTSSGKRNSPGRKRPEKTKSSLAIGGIKLGTRRHAPAIPSPLVSSEAKPGPSPVPASDGAAAPSSLATPVHPHATRNRGLRHEPRTEVSPSPKSPKKSPHKDIKRSISMTSSLATDPVIKSEDVKPHVASPTSSPMKSASSIAESCESSLASLSSAELLVRPKRLSAGKGRDLIAQITGAKRPSQSTHTAASTSTHTEESIRQSSPNPTVPVDDVKPETAVPSTTTLAVKEEVVDSSGNELIPAEADEFDRKSDVKSTEQEVKDTAVVEDVGSKSIRATSIRPAKKGVRSKSTAMTNASNSSSGSVSKSEDVTASSLPFIDSSENLRKSRRTQVLTPKMMDLAKTRPERGGHNDLKIEAKPGSALEILNKLNSRKVVSRSPSPPPVAISPMMRPFNRRTSVVKSDASAVIEKSTAISPLKTEESAAETNVDVTAVVDTVSISIDQVVDAISDEKPMRTEPPAALEDQMVEDSTEPVDGKPGKTVDTSSDVPLLEDDASRDGLMIADESDQQQQVKEEDSSELDRTRNEDEHMMKSPSPSATPTAVDVNIDRDTLEPTSSKGIVTPGRSKGKLLSEARRGRGKSDALAQAPFVSPTTPSTSSMDNQEGGRSSRRIVKPTRFDDFVTEPVTRKPPSASHGSREKSDVSPKKESTNSTTGIEVATVATPHSVPAVSTQTSLPSTSALRKVKPAFTMKTRRRSKDSAARPIKIKLRFAGSRAEVIENTGALSSEATTSEETDGQQTADEGSGPSQQRLDSDDVGVVSSRSGPPATPAGIAKAKSRKSARAYEGYIPSMKPQIEDIIHADGSVEKLGIQISIIMDKMLAEVCQDGIIRHNHILSTKDKKKRALALQKQRYLEKKAEYEQLVIDCRARGVQPPKFSHTLGNQNRRTGFMSPTSDNADDGVRAERSNRAGIYKQNEFLLKTVKARKAMEEEEAETQDNRTRKALDYMSHQFQKDLDDAMMDENRPLPQPKKRRTDTSEYSPSTSAAVDYVPIEKRRREKEREYVPLASYLSSRPSSSNAVQRDTRLLPDPSISDAPHDFFYRDIMHDISPCTANEAAIDDDVNVMDEDEPGLNAFVIPEGHAMPVVRQIEQLMMRPADLHGCYSISDLYSRASEEPETRRALLDRTIDIICGYYHVEQTAVGSDRRVVLHNSAMKHASELRDVFAMFTAERMEAVKWLHRYLVELLPAHFLSVYLLILRYCKYLPNSYISTVVKSTANELNHWPEVTELITEYLSRKVTDPELEQLDSTVAVDALSDVVFVLLSPFLKVADYRAKTKSHERIFEWLKQLGDGASDVVKMSKGDNFSMKNIAEVCDLFVDELVGKLKHLSRVHRDKRIVLVGWQTTCYFAHRAVQRTHGVSAIIDLAFPVLTYEGPRGTADDDILTTYCPSLFVVGSEAEDFDPVAMKEMRNGMLMNTGLVVVGHADHNLSVSTTVLNQTNTTQKMVHRSILEQVIEFLQLKETRRERSQLIQAELNNVYGVDANLLSRPVDKDKGRHRDGHGTIIKEERRGRKKKVFCSGSDNHHSTGLLSMTTSSHSSSHSHAFSSSSHMPSLSAERNAPPASASEARNRFDQLVKKVAVPLSTDGRRRSDDVRERDLHGASRDRGDLKFREPKAPPPGYKGSPLPSPSLTSAPSSFTMTSSPSVPPSSLSIAAAPSSASSSQQQKTSSLVDPASISLG